MLVDSHCHLEFPDFADDIEDVVARAKGAGVHRMLTIGTRVGRFAAVRALAERFDDIYCSVGTHPHNAGEEIDVTSADLLHLARHPKVVAIGETGLDFHYDHSPRDVQEAVFRRHIAAARESGLPLVIHSRNADEEMIDILSGEMEKGRFDAVLHCFSSGAGLAAAAVELGFYISFSGILTFRKADDLRAIAADLPAERILVETDAPYLAPVPHRGRRNEPAFVAETAAVLADARGVEIKTIARQTTENFFTLFAGVPRPDEAR